MRGDSCSLLPGDVLGDLCREMFTEEQSDPHLGHCAASLGERRSREVFESWRAVRSACRSVQKGDAQKAAPAAPFYKLLIRPWRINSFCEPTAERRKPHREPAHSRDDCA